MEPGLEEAAADGEPFLDEFGAALLADEDEADFDRSVMGAATLSITAFDLMKKLGTS
jgi:hypothetical protein